MACSRCGASRRQAQIPSGIRAGSKPSTVVPTPAGRAAQQKGVRESITGLRYVPSGK